MSYKKLIISLLMLSIITTCVSSRSQGYSKNDIESLKKVKERLRRSFHDAEEEKTVPFSPKTLETMLEKAILKIITGDLSTGDMLLLRSLNYSLEEVLTIRERELAKKNDRESKNRKKNKHNSQENEDKITKNFGEPEEEFEEDSEEDEDVIDVDAYNRQAVLDYENLANKMEAELKESREKNSGIEDKNKDIQTDKHVAFDDALEPRVIFKIRYNDSDMNSVIENNEQIVKKNTIDTNVEKNIGSSASSDFYSSMWNPFHSSELSTLPIPYQLSVSEESSKEKQSNSTKNVEKENLDLKNENVNATRRIQEYEGLEWVEDDVYRVVPEALNDEMENEEVIEEFHSLNSSNEEMANDDLGYQANSNLPQEDGASSWNDNGVGNLSTYQQLALAHRRDQGQKAIEDIKLRVLAMTGRFNLTSNSNQIQRERLTMFSPICQIPRNTDLDVWSDQLLMNMYFQLNLTSEDHVVAARLRIYKLPQNNTTPSSTTNPFEEDEEEEKKIRISIYYYTRSLKKHRSKKRLMDSVVTPLTSEGSHLALDVRQALRFWRQTPRIHGSSTNHGLVIQVEDQDGRPLKPSLYIQQDSCHSSGKNTDNKAYQRVPALFLRACSRYVRVVKGEAITYVNCKHITRNRHRS
ncbi:uncharacterized protein [Chelonus insularis]|uniref:uncharacterized protein isoform X2 n=1 Tax=Chelonus insularis TaxID=460826 RepID=UPI00158E0A26|nr:uncharacterized protein LOC118074547 isoform X2 [Chelonus insularis]